MKNISKSILLLFTIAVISTSCSSDSDNNKPIVPPTPGSVKDIYVCGTEKKSDAGNNIATYWKNGVAVYLSDGTKNEGLIDIEVVGDDVYACGYERNATNTQSIPKYWKNEIPIILSSLFGNANCIAVSENNVYIGGSAGDKAVFWINDAANKNILGATSYPTNTINDIKIVKTASGTDIYYVGLDDSKAVYWKNSTKTTLTDGYATAAQIVGSDI